MLPGDCRAIQGQFSLAGAQPKTAFLLQKGRWGVPPGRIPTTHILKPPTGQFDGHAENEHICRMLAALAWAYRRRTRRSFGISGEEIAIVIERYDRQPTLYDTRLVPMLVDVCQALGIMPTRKYQNEGGPTPSQHRRSLAHLFDRIVQADVDAFIAALGFNWLIAGTDAHAKNYSLLLGDPPIVRLAPLYDVASILPYDEFDLHKVKLAMKVGGKYKLSPRRSTPVAEIFARNALWMLTKYVLG